MKFPLARLLGWCPEATWIERHSVENKALVTALEKLSTSIWENQRRLLWH